MDQRIRLDGHRLEAVRAARPSVDPGGCQPKNTAGDKVNQNYFAWETKAFSDLFRIRLSMKLDKNKDTRVNLYSFNRPGPRSRI